MELRAGIPRTGSDDRKQNRKSARRKFAIICHARAGVGAEKKSRSLRSGSKNDFDGDVDSYWVGIDGDRTESVGEGAERLEKSTMMQYG